MSKEYEAMEFLRNNPDLNEQIAREIESQKDNVVDIDKRQRSKNSSDKEIGSEGKKSFEPSFYETPTGYKKKVVLKDNETGKKEEIEKTVAPFIIDPKELISCEDVAEWNAKITYDGEEYSATLSTKDFLSPKEFKSAISKKISPAIWFDGNQKELTNIQKILEKKPVKKIKGVKCSGFHKLNNEWHYVTSKGALKADNSIFDGISLLSNSKEIENPNILNNEPLSTDEIRQLAESLFKFNSLGITTSFIGYISALFLKERLFDEFEMKFPNMAVIGSSGAGKSQTMESIGMSILNMRSNSQYAANQCTKFTGLKNSSSSNTTPFIINEYKPHKMAQWIINDIDNLMNNTYDRYESKRGKADLSTETYTFNAPVILLGEAYNPDQSAIDRLIRIYLTKDESMKSFEKFKILKALKPLLNKLGKALLIKALGVNKEQISQWLNDNSKLVETTNIGVTRGKENVVITLLGLDLLNETLGKCLDSHITKLKNAVSDRYSEDTLDGNASSKTAIGEVLEFFNQMVVEGHLIEGSYFKRIEKNGELVLDTKSIFNRCLEVLKNRGQALPLSEGEFTRMLKKESFYKDYRAVKIKSLSDSTITETRKCFVLDISKLSNLSQLDLDTILGIETPFNDGE